MARNGSGTYSIPNTFVSGNTITASGHNQNMADIATEITNSVAADGQTSMTAPLKGSNGSAGAPTFTFASDPDSGWYRIGANNVGLSLNGAKVLDVATTGLAIAGLDIINGTQLTTLASDDTLVVYDLSATANKRILVSDFLNIIGSLTPRGYIDGCILSNGTDATNDINISAGVCRDSTNTVNISVAANTAGKQLDANWAAAPTTNTGMRNSNVSISDTTWHIFAAAQADGTQTIYADSSASEATALGHLQAETGGSGYLFMRRIGSIVRSGAAIRAFNQIGDRFRWKIPQQSVSVSNPGTSAVTRTLDVPTGLIVFSDLAVQVNPVSTNPTVYLSALDETDSTPSSSILSFPSGAGSIPLGGQITIKTNTSAQIRSRQSTSGASDTFIIITNGWIDPRGKDA